MSNQQHNWIKPDYSKFPRTIKKGFVQGTVIATLLALTPYLFSLQESVPQEKVWDTFLFTYESKVWKDVNLLMWIVTGKAVPLFLLFIWFFTNRHWWYHVLLVPIIMYIYQLFSLFNEDQAIYDEFQFMYMLPVMAIIIPSIYLIRAKMFNKINDVEKSMEELEEEFRIGGKGFFRNLSDYF